jgi:vesicle-fusing ATPase
VLFARRPPKVRFPSHWYLIYKLTISQGRRLLIISTTSLRPVLTELGFSDVFDSELHIPAISDLRSFEHVLREVELFRSSDDRRRAIGMLQQAGFGSDSRPLNIGIKKLLSIIEMARQEPEAVAERLTTALMGLGM